MFLSIMSLSILLSTNTALTLSSHACFRTVCVYGLTPSSTSTMTTAPSDSLNALLTSLEKSTWPGESIRLIRYCLSSNCYAS